MEVVFLVFLILLLLGMPVAFAAGISGVLFFLQNPSLANESVVLVPVTATQDSVLVAVPLFILAGVLMNASGITERLLNFAKVLTGHVRGGLSQSSVVLSVLMGGATGSANAEIAMESRILAPSMTREGYPKGYTASVIGYSAMITAAIPPSIGLILYGSTGGVSIGRLFAAGLLSGLVLFVIMFAYVSIVGRIRDYPQSRETRPNALDIFKGIRDSAFALAFPVLLLGSLRLGLFTVTEIGALACAYATFVGVFVYRKLTFRDFFRSMKVGTGDASGIMFLIAMAALFGYGIPFERIPSRASEFILSLEVHPWVTILFILLFLLVIGMFLDGAVVIILATPVLLPVVIELGVDPVVFGIVLVLVATVAVLTPPFGIGMFIMRSIIRMPLGAYFKESLPFLLLISLTVILLMIFSDTVLLLPNMIYG